MVRLLVIALQKNHQPFQQKSQSITTKKKDLHQLKSGRATKTFYIFICNNNYYLLFQQKSQTMTTKNIYLQHILKKTHTITFKNTHIRSKSQVYIAAFSV